MSEQNKPLHSSVEFGLLEQGPSWKTLGQQVGTCLIRPGGFLDYTSVLINKGIDKEEQLKWVLPVEAAKLYLLTEIVKYTGVIDTAKEFIEKIM